MASRVDADTQPAGEASPPQGLRGSLRQRPGLEVAGEPALPAWASAAGAGRGDDQLVKALAVFAPDVWNRPQAVPPKPGLLRWAAGQGEDLHRVIQHKVGWIRSLPPSARMLRLSQTTDAVGRAGTSRPRRPSAAAWLSAACSKLLKSRRWPAHQLLHGGRPGGRQVESACLIRDLRAAADLL